MKKILIAALAACALVACLFAVGCGDKGAEPAVCDLETGTYSVDFESDRMSMFHLNEICEGKATLIVQDGAMTVHLIMPSQNIVGLYLGTADEAKNDPNGVIEASQEDVVFPDGWEETVNAFDLPVPVLDEPFSVALIGTKGTWYDHTVTLSNAVPN